jgi:hypothetical protein
MNAINFKTGDVVTDDMHPHIKGVVISVGSLDVTVVFVDNTKFTYDQGVDLYHLSKVYG